MKIKSLDIYNVRNINNANLIFSPGINVVFGDNGSGKSSILEAIHHLSTGSSFRTKHIKKIIQHNQSSMAVRAELSNFISIAIAKQISKPTIVKVNNDPIHSASVLARYLPLQIVFDDVFQIIDCGPSVRRSFLDWGLFHVEPSYYQCFSNYKKALTQRNLLLKKGSKDLVNLKAWEQSMISSGLILNQFRQRYLDKLIPKFKIILTGFNSVLDININYHHGWGQTLTEFNDKNLLNTLNDSRIKDFELGYSNRGAHRADLRINCDNNLAKDQLSRGQQKLVLIALKLAQASMLSDDCLFLIDDLSAELDSKTIRQILKYLKKNQIQTVMTCLDPEDNLFQEFSDQMFHVKHGSVMAVNGIESCSIES